MSIPLDSKAEKPVIWLKKNDPIQAMVELARQQHVGDEGLLCLHILSAHSLSIIGDVDPLHISTIGRSGKGKGHCAHVVKQLFPSEMILPLASFSPKSFFYAGEKINLNGKIIHCPEVPALKEDDDRLALLRQLTDSPNRTETGKHWTIDDKRKFQSLEIKGRFTFWFNSQDPIKDDHVLNRIIIVNTNETKEQDLRVNEIQTESLALLKKRNNSVAIKYMQEINSFLLRQTVEDVFIPWIKYVDFPQNCMDNRRLFPQFLTLIKCITKMREVQRESIEWVGNGRTMEVLLSSPEDIELAIALFNPILPVTSMHVSKRAFDVLEHIPLTKETPVTKNELSDVTGWPADTCYRYCTELLRAGLIYSDRSQMGRGYVYWRPSLESSGGVRNASEIRANWPSFDKETLVSFIQQFSESLSLKTSAEKLAEKFVGLHDFHPTWLKSYEEANRAKLSQSNSEIRISPNSKSLENDYPKDQQAKSVPVEVEIIH